MFNVLTLNSISESGLRRFPKENYGVASEQASPDAILLRSFNMHGMDIAPSVKVIGRAGAGVNNIPVDEFSKRGIPVFNAPGANANAVKELVVAGMLLACRHICQAWEYTRHLSGDDASIHRQVEDGKKRFVGFELPGRVLGVIGLGAIGVQVANVALKLGMQVIAYDPKITVQSAWKLSSDARQAASLNDLLSKADFITFHVPLEESTHHTINPDSIKLLKPGAVILNFSREGIVDDDAVCKALDNGKLYAYVCDYSSNLLMQHERVITLPHIGASTREAEENCAVMVVEQVRDYLENGNIVNSVNFPEVVLPKTEGFRIGIANANVPNMVGQISTAMAKADLNIIDLINKSRGDIAYTLADVNSDIPDAVIQQIKSIDGVLNVRVI